MQTGRHKKSSYSAQLLTAAVRCKKGGRAWGPRIHGIHELLDSKKVNHILVNSIGRLKGTTFQGSGILMSILLCFV